MPFLKSLKLLILSLLLVCEVTLWGVELCYEAHIPSPPDILPVASFNGGGQGQISAIGAQRFLH